MYEVLISVVILWQDTRAAKPNRVGVQVTTRAVQPAVYYNGGILSVERRNH